MARLEALYAGVQVGDEQRQIPDQLRGPRGWRSVKDLTSELRFSSEDACRTWLRRQRIANVRRGRVILVDSRDVDAALRRER